MGLIIAIFEVVSRLFLKQFLKPFKARHEVSRASIRYS